MKMISSSEADALVPARALNEVVYCPRLYHLMYVQGLFDDSVDTIEGRFQHQRRRPRRKAANASDAPDETETPWTASATSALTLSAPDAGITGKFDAIFEDGKGTTPVEDKHGPAPDGSTPFTVGPRQLSPHAWGNDQVQAAAQIALLRANGYSCDGARIHYRKTNTTVDLPWTDDLAAALAWAVEEARRIAAAPMPPPLIDSNKCIRCSLNHICLPDETRLLRGETLEEPRQLHPGRDEAAVLYLTTPGARLTKSGENLKIVFPDGAADAVPLKEVAHVCVIGAGQVTTQAMNALVDQGAAIAWLSAGGWLRAVTQAPLTKNVSLRRSQFLAFSDTVQCLPLARAVVTAKIANQRTLIRRNRRDSTPGSVLDDLRSLQQQAAEATAIDSLRGTEGAAARAYWTAFPSLLEPPCDQPLPMHGRNRRPPRDPVNAMLSYGYALLLRDFHNAAALTGLDPLFGFYHTLVAGRPALALDLMEPYRPLVVDSVLIRAVNEGAITAADFLTTPGHCAFKDAARRRWIAAYERRVDDWVTHPAFGYRLSYRRVFQLEARLLGRVIEGEHDAYTPLVTR